MPFLNTALWRSVNKKTTRKKQTNKQKQNFHGKNSYLNFKGPSDNVKMQPDQTLTTQINSFLTIQQMEYFFKEIW